MKALALKPFFRLFSRESRRTECGKISGLPGLIDQWHCAMLGLLGFSPSHKVHTQLCTYCFSLWNILLSYICMVYSFTSFRLLPKYCLLTQTIPALLFKFAHKYCTVFLHPPFILFIVISRIIAPYYISSFLVSFMRGKTFSKYL